MSMFSGMRPHDLENALKSLVESGYRIELASGPGVAESERKVHAFKTAAVILYCLQPSDFSDGQPWAEMAKAVHNEGFATKIPEGVDTLFGASVLGAMRCAAAIYEGQR